MRIALTGDSIIMRPVLHTPDAATRELAALLQGADVVFTNLEVLPNDFRGDPSFENDGSHLAAPAAVLDELKARNVNLIATCNNHSLDYGISGLRIVLAELDKRGLAHAGCGSTLENARMPVYLERPQGTVSMLACCSTFPKGKEAGAQRPDMQGRPGLNPLRFDVMHEVTPAQFEALGAISEELGLGARQREKIQLGFGFAPDDPSVLAFNGANYRAAERPAIRYRARQRDLDGIAKWVREARGRSDIVIVSLHAHEQGASIEEPAEFLPVFARRMIDEGADMVVGHGPHLLRGAELYRGKPIFYSLGNFIGQNELTYKLPADSYDLFRVAQDQTPGKVYSTRADNDRKGFPADRRYWESVMPVCRYEDNRLAGITIHPLALGFGELPHKRGRPRLALGAEGRAILERFAALCRPFGTVLAIGEGQAEMRIGG